MLQIKKQRWLLFYLAIAQKNFPLVSYYPTHILSFTNFSAFITSEPKLAGQLILSCSLRFSEELAEKNNQSSGYFFLAFIIYLIPQTFTKARLVGD